jgi:hypothetical protein
MASTVPVWLRRDRSARSAIASNDAPPFRSTARGPGF